ncbi:ferritin-like domain-containing protein [Piscinibacter terrae]|uniref:PA2169 family four-helix-bundle protein n=1 Tax=Piscinibacter terrae TaxID=2496871 RepID=A0A3N7HL40_9BURK|nr:PA2169 family four-helix-bundle protein [Albitalea terrae]RQP22817.1 PA2169 family four-helix-bundle protein [Albitalea terrae]
MSNDDIVDTLNDLIETCKDGEYGFGACAKHATSAELSTLFLQRAAECKTAAAELEPYVVQYGGKPDHGGSASGALHRGWVAVRGSLVGFTDQAMLDECERGEDAALARYRKALKEDLPEQLLALVQRQQLGVQRNHDQIKSLRDHARASAGN